MHSHGVSLSLFNHVKVEFKSHTFLWSHISLQVVMLSLDQLTAWDRACGQILVFLAPYLCVLVCNLFLCIRDRDENGCFSFFLFW